MNKYKGTPIVERKEEIQKKLQKCSHFFHDDKLDKALELVRGMTRIPIGQDPERDKEIKRAWSRGA